MSAQPAAAVEFTGVVHPLAAVWPLLDADELQTLAESIAENGQQSPIVLDAHGRLVDGRNRLAAIDLLDGVDPWFQGDPDLSSEPAIAAFIRAANADRRHLSAGQQAMGRALMLQAQGHRKNGRWERGSVTNVTDGSDGERVLLVKAGLVLDVAERARALDDGWDDYANLPAQVMDRTATLDFAYKVAGAFEGKAALAEALKEQPLNEAIALMGVILDDAAQLLPMPDIPLPLTKGHRSQLTALAHRSCNQAKGTKAVVRGDVA